MKLKIAKSIRKTPIVIENEENGEQSIIYKRQNSNLAFFQKINFRKCWNAENLDFFEKEILTVIFLYFLSAPVLISRALSTDIKVNKCSKNKNRTKVLKKNVFLQWWIGFWKIIDLPWLWRQRKIFNQQKSVCSS